MIRGFKNNKVISVIVILIIVGGFYLGFKRSETTTNSSNNIKTSIAERGSIKLSVTGSGQVSAVGQVDLRPQIAGDGLDVLSVNVKNNQEVKKGESYSSLDPKDAQDAIRDAELNLRSSEIKLKQIKKSYDSKTEDDKWARQLQEIAVQENRNRLADAKENLQDYYIRAPFDGIVTGLSVEAGDSISRDETLASIITKDMNASISLNEVDAIKVKTGDKAILSFDALDDVSLEGTVQKVDTIGTVDQGVVYYNAEISIDEKNDLLKPGMSVTAEIIIDSKQNVITVPISAVQNDGEGDYVQIVSIQGESESVIRKKVEVGITDGVMIEIVAGISEGDRVVTGNSSQRSASSQEDREESRGLFDFSRPGGKILDEKRND